MQPNFSPNYLVIIRVLLLKKRVDYKASYDIGQQKMIAIEHIPAEQGMVFRKAKKVKKSEVLPQ